MISLPPTKTQLIKDIQKLLIEKGYMASEASVSGMMDPDTTSGIDLYLATKKLTIFDVVTDKVWQLLQEELAAENAANNTK